LDSILRRAKQQKELPQKNTQHTKTGTGIEQKQAGRACTHNENNG
jgi:hypothetical protein